MKERFRVDQLLSRFGYCSRSEARFWVRGGRVMAAGEVVKQADQKVVPADVFIDGQPVDHPHGLLVVLNKPAGCVCSTDEREGANVFALVPPRWQRRNPAITTIGRLDKDTTGVLLLTDQGELVQRWTSPKHKVPKVYEVTLDKAPAPELVALFASGSMRLEGEEKPCAPAGLEPGEGVTVRLTLTEGRFHQVKRMFALNGYLVTALHRSRFGEFTAEGLPPGAWRIASLPGALSVAGLGGTE